MEEEKKERKLILITTFIFVIVVSFPLMVADLVYGFSGDECLTIYPSTIHVNLKSYLVTSGLMQLFSMIFITYELYVIYNTEKLPICLMVTSIVFKLLYGMFMFAWNIVAAVVFWDYIYKQGNCEKDVSTYLFASIIIKLILTYMNLNNSNKKDD